MIEVVRGIVSHAELLHDASGPQIIRYGERDNFIQCRRFEAVAQRRPSAFRSQALSPILGRQPPADFNARREVRDETWHVQSDEADERPIAPDFRGEQAESVLAKVFLHTIHALIAFSAR